MESTWRLSQQGEVAPCVSHINALPAQVQKEKSDKLSPAFSTRRYESILHTLNSSILVPLTLLFLCLCVLIPEQLEKMWDARGRKWDKIVKKLTAQNIYTGKHIVLTKLFLGENTKDAIDQPAKCIDRRIKIFLSWTATCFLWKRKISKRT